MNKLCIDIPVSIKDSKKGKEKNQTKLRKDLAEYVIISCPITFYLNLRLKSIFRHSFFFSLCFFYQFRSTFFFIFARPDKSY